jgi:hypothetical protein
MMQQSPLNGSNGNTPQKQVTVVPRFFLIVSGILAVLILIAGGITFIRLKSSYDLPDSVKALASRSGTLSQIRSRALAPPDNARLTPEKVGLFIGALDPIRIGWEKMKHTLDSINRTGKGKGKVDFWGSPYFVRQVNMMPLDSRRQLVTYLNQKGLSWEEYVWLKEHVIAASGLTRGEFDSTFDVQLRHYFRSEDSSSTNATAVGAAELFKDIDVIRSRGIDSSDAALAAPYRTLLLDKGFPALLGVETRFAENE